MKQTWHKAEVSLGKTHEPGYWTAFFKWDLRAWTVGFQVDIDECWFEVRFCFGPPEVAICYWRRPVFMFDADSST